MTDARAGLTLTNRGWRYVTEHGAESWFKPPIDAKGTGRYTPEFDAWLAEARGDAEVVPIRP